MKVLEYKNPEKGFEYTKKAANAGDLQSQFNLGNAFRKGNFVKQDYTKAAFWYENQQKLVILFLKMSMVYYLLKV
jgi:TPR repeat protein